MRLWVVQEDAPVSLAVLPLRRRPGDLRAAVARLRGACLRAALLRRAPTFGPTYPRIAVA